MKLPKAGNNAPLRAETEARQPLLQACLCCYGDCRVQVPGNSIKRIVQSWFVGENERTQYDFSRHMIEPELSGRIAGAEIMISGG